MSRTWKLFLLTPMIAAGFVVACGGDDDGGGGSTPTNDGGGTDATNGGGDTSTNDDGGDPSKQDTAAPETLTFTTYATFSVIAGELPEGLVVVAGKPIVSFAPAGKVMNVLPDGGTTVFGTFTTPSNTYTLGLALNAQNDVFATIAATGASPTPTPGLYKMPSTGGAPGAYNTGGVAMPGFNNGIDIIGTDTFVSDSTGKIFKVDQSGVASEWKSDPELVGDKAACNSPNAFAIGVNGISHDNDYLYAVNFDKGSFLRIKRNANGTAGPVEQLFKNCDFFGADGIAHDTDGSFIVANNPKNRIDRVTLGILGSANATYKTIGKDAPLDGPASVFIEGTAPNKKLWVTNSAFGSAATDGGSPKPSLVSAPLK